jgi:hypothetical protein
MQKAIYHVAVLVFVFRKIFIYALNHTRSKNGACQQEMTAKAVSHQVRMKSATELQFQVKTLRFKNAFQFI